MSYKKIRVRSLVAIVFILIVLVHLLISLIRINTSVAPDFSVYYQSAENLLQRLDVYDDPTLYTGLGYPPVSLLPYLPLTVLPYHVAQALWSIVSVFALWRIVAVTLGLYMVKPDWKYVAVCTCSMYLLFPVRYTLGMGQVNLIAFWLILEGVVRIVHNKQIALSIMGVSLSLLLKPHFALLLFPFFIARKFYELAGIFLIVALAILSSGIVFGWEQYMSYADKMLPSLVVFQDRGIYYNQGLSAFLSRALPVQIASHVYLPLIAVSTIFHLYMITRTKKFSMWISFLLGIPFFLIIEPLAWQHHFVLLVPVVLWLWFVVQSHTERILLATGLFLVGVNIRNPDFFNGSLSQIFIVSHAFWGVMLMYILAVCMRSRGHV